MTCQSQTADENTGVYISLLNTVFFSPGPHCLSLLPLHKLFFSLTFLYHCLMVILLLYLFVSFFGKENNIAIFISNQLMCSNSLTETHITKKCVFLHHVNSLMSKQHPKTWIPIVAIKFTFRKTIIPI